MHWRNFVHTIFLGDLDSHCLLKINFMHSISLKETACFKYQNIASEKRKYEMSIFFFFFSLQK